MNSVHNNQYTSNIEMYMCRYVIYKCVANTSPGRDPVSTMILRSLVGLFLGDPVSILRCVSLPW